MLTRTAAALAALALAGPAHAADKDTTTLIFWMCPASNPACGVSEWPEGQPPYTEEAPNPEVCDYLFTLLRDSPKVTPKGFIARHICKPTKARLADCARAEVLVSLENEGMEACSNHDTAKFDEQFYRRGARLARDRIQSCPTTPDSSALMKSGRDDFQSTVKRIGKEAACKALDDTITAFEDAED
jgi:hypothetical protein